jgi:hypothetical protein
MEKSRAMAKQSMDAAIASLSPLGEEHAKWLREIALFLGARQS